MPTFIHGVEQTATDSTEKLLDLAELLPPGNGFVKVNSDRSITLETPSGGGSGTGQQFFEKLTIASNNVFPPLSFTPRLDMPFVILINGTFHLRTAEKYTVNAATRTISLTAGVGYGVIAGWKCEALYYTDNDISAPSITSISPASVTAGQTLTIDGTGFTTNASVSLGGFSVTATVVSSTQITLVVPNLQYTSNIVEVTTVTGTATSTFGYVFPVPTISTFAPIAASSGATVTITGTNFTGATQVRFGGVDAASFVVNSPTQITATVGTGASGNVSVTTLGGTATQPGFTWQLGAPVITSISPVTSFSFFVTIGSELTITGQNFSGITSVKIGGTPVESYVVDSATQIRAIVGVGNIGGSSIVSVESATGTGSFAQPIFSVAVLPFARAGSVQSIQPDTITNNGTTRVIVSATANTATAWRLFSNSVGDGSFWVGFPVPQSLSVQFAQPTGGAPVNFPIRVGSYRLFSGEDVDSIPRDWVLEGSNNGTAWTALDTRSAQVWSVSAWSATFTIAAPAMYSYYRIRFLAVQSGIAVALQEIQLNQG
jgi:hypothetical protein